jgi:hypothetical protein
MRNFLSFQWMKWEANRAKITSELYKLFLKRLSFGNDGGGRL